MNNEIRVKIPLDNMMCGDKHFLLDKLKEAGVPLVNRTLELERGFLYKKYSTDSNDITYIWRLTALPKGKELPLVSS